MRPLPDGDPDPSTAFDGHADSYDAALQRGLSLSGETREYFSAGRLRHLYRRLSAMPFTPKSVLDYGCGDGSTTPLFFDILGATSVVGADTSAALLAKAKGAYQSDATRFHLLTDRVPAADCDLAFCNGVFHHIPPPDRPGAVRYVLRSLRPGGLFAFWENNPWNPGTRWVMRRIAFDRDAIPITAPEGRRLLRESGFDILSTDFLFVFPRALSWCRPLERYLTSVPAGAQYLILSRKPGA